jgi:hypothetical protein
VKRGIVIDTSVARSAGGRDATEGRAAASKDALELIRREKLRAVVSDELLEEYRRQTRMSLFFRQWLVWMTDKERLWRVDAKPHRPTRLAAQQILSPERQRAVEKDLHLVGAALASDRRVLSADDRMRADLVALTAQVRALAKIHWANPEAARCLDWLSRSAPDDRAWRLEPRRGG